MEMASQKSKKISRVLYSLIGISPLLIVLFLDTGHSEILFSILLISLILSAFSLYQAALSFDTSAIKHLYMGAMTIPLSWLFIIAAIWVLA